MSFPQIAVKATNIELTSNLSALIDQKFITLEKLIPKEETDVRCRVEVEKLTEHKSGKIYRVESNLFVSGKTFRAEATEEQVEKAIDEVRDELKRELEKSHGKRKSLFRRGAQRLKDMLRFGRQ